MDLAIQGVWQNFYLDDDLDASVVDLTTWAVNVHASKTFGALTLFGGIQREHANVKVQYLLESDDVAPGVNEIDPNEPVEVRLDLDSANSFRVIGGFSVHFGPVLLAADLNLGNVRTASATLGFSI